MVASSAAGRPARARRLRRARAGEYVAPIAAPYRGLELYECPPNGQGVIALLLAEHPRGLRPRRRSTRTAPAPASAGRGDRLAYRDRDACWPTRASADVPVGRLLDEALRRRARGADRPRAGARRPAAAASGAHPDTVYLTVVDRDRNAVSFINSIFDGFGCGLVCAETGVLFHNRGTASPRSPPSQRGRPRQAADAHDHPRAGAARRPAGAVPSGSWAATTSRSATSSCSPTSSITAWTRRGRSTRRASSLTPATLQIETGVPAATAPGLAGLGHRW